MHETEWVALDAPVVLDQLVHSTMSCGPAALATALMAEGGAPARAVLEQGDGVIATSVDTYGTRTGRGGTNPRFDPASGVAPDDLVDWTNDWRADLGTDLDAGPRVGVYLDRNEGESDEELCARVHGLLVRSLSDGAVPIVRVRAFAPGWYPQRGAYLWDGIAAHWIAILGVPRELGADARGFAFDYADPDGGTVERGFAGVETQREFTAARGDTVHWSWLAGRPFLLVTAPGLESLGRARQPWFLRTIVTLDHAIVPSAVLGDGWSATNVDAAGAARGAHDAGTDPDREADQEPVLGPQDDATTSEASDAPATP
ncbi:hypothetical protein Pla163_30130 [Planctomycetes bacterium Pla163]|uniref:Uncharacterized protein n=1 Tax=Rohdeia mirabilis TaxID=2528008 RepID=A0A518D317_9BACT|nr:hypothetical protein Pla163_30130 [Planctomycetes bacterium Pla163]